MEKFLSLNQSPPVLEQFLTAATEVKIVLPTGKEMATASSKKVYLMLKILVLKKEKHYKNWFWYARIFRDW